MLASTSQEVVKLGSKSNRLVALFTILPRGVTFY